MKKQPKQILDVQTSPEIRKKVEQAVKGHNRQKGSKFFKESVTWVGYSYNQSMKK